MQNEDSVECDAECLLEAEEIKKDPDRMAAVNKYLEEKKQDIASIQDIKNAYKKENNKYDLDEEQAKDLPPPELMTDEDKASVQKMMHYNKKEREMMDG